MRLPALCALGRRRRQPGCDAPRPAGPGDPQRLPGGGGRLPPLGVRRISLNFSFLRGVLVAGAESDAPLGLRLERWALQRLSRWFQIQTLYRFNKKFGPSWVPRYLAVEAIEDLPRVALGALRLEGLFAPPRRRERGERTDQDAPTPDRDGLPTHTS